MKRTVLRQPRTGFLLKETAMAVLIVSAAIGAACELMHLAAVQRRFAEHRQLATQELANVMEEILTRPFDDLDSEDISVAISPTAQRRLPRAQWRLKVTPEENPSRGLQITLEMDWEVSDGRSPAIRLVAWRYPLEETTP